MAARRHHYHRAGRARPPFSLLPPYRGEVGRGVPPLGAPASRRPRAKRERGCGPSARHAGGTPALPGSSPMGGIGNIPVRAAVPLGLLSSPLKGGRREDPGGGEKTARPASLFGHRERSPNRGPLTPPPVQGESEDEFPSAIALGRDAGRSLSGVRHSRARLLPRPGEESAEGGRPGAWRSWGFRAGGAARGRAPGVPPEKISRDNFAAPADGRKITKSPQSRPAPAIIRLHGSGMAPGRGACAPPAFGPDQAWTAGAPPAGGPYLPIPRLRPIV